MSSKYLLLLEYDTCEYDIMNHKGRVGDGSLQMRGSLGDPAVCGLALPVNLYAAYILFELPFL